MAIPQEILDRSPYPSVLESGEQVLKAEVLDATERAQNWLLEQQHSDGYWAGELEGDTILESEYIILLTFLGLEKNIEKIKKLAKYLIQNQQDQGGWSIYPGAAPDLSSTVKAYFALKLAGYNINESFMQKTKKLIIELGGIEQTNCFTKIYLAVLGQYPWEKCPAIPPELVLLPTWFYFNIYSMSSWSRTIVVPLSIIWAYKPVIKTPVDISELLVDSHDIHTDRKSVPFFSWKNFFMTVDKCFKAVERIGFIPLRKPALRSAEKWIRERLQKSDGLGAIFPPMVNAIMALMLLGYDENHPDVVEELNQLRTLEIVEDGVMRMQPCLSPIWDTALAITALHEGGVESHHPSLVNAAQWLLEKEVKIEGDWKVTNSHLSPGGWAFEFCNEFYPDLDDTAMVLISLARAAHDGKEGAIRRGIEWVFGMQGRDGGWAAFDRDNNHEIFTQVPFADHNAMLDPSCADITGRILEMLGGYRFNVTHPSLRRAIEYLKDTQESEGCWYGRWGVNYIYGTWQVLKGLSCVGEDMDAPYVLRAARWLKEVQNSDGGWGESCSSYDDPSSKGVGTSTPSQTAWALMGLMATGDYESPAVKNGMKWLLANQTPKGTWSEEAFTGTGFPKVFYLRYHLYRHYFPLFALGMFMNKKVLKEVS